MTRLHGSRHIAGEFFEFVAGRCFAYGIARMRRCRWVLLIAFACVIGLLRQQPVSAQVLAVRPPEQTRYVQRLNAKLPLSGTFVDDNGRPTRLGEYFGDQPVVLVLGYFHCPNLCSTLMDGVLETLAAAGVPPHAYRVLGVSIDPSETPGLAARKKASYAPLLANTGVQLTLLTGAKPEVDALASSVGFEYVYDGQLQQYVHPAGFIVATPDGRVSHYFMGVRFDPRDVRLALIDASSGSIGSPVDQLLLLCLHYDPVTGRYSPQVIAGVRAVCLMVLAGLVIWLWRATRRA
ncbi:SCO family protein [Paraburkholderia diazotrophica]|uniref:Protein SCO1/2 n=1 Tax=Paraburkholderia diazotrophica TaxID=667676 RepID=A0A1H6WBW5_9BURK|nr:SCO family protein [Paraburkholderia diazotrophica]SEJ14519.1 protein SCO1/2 [Paraburkholderia diazotrophica]